jgi:hypothetical protein
MSKRLEAALSSEVNPRRHEKNPIITSVMDALGEPMQHQVLRVNPQGRIELTNDFLIPIVLKGHKRKQTPSTKVCNQTVDFRIIQVIKRGTLHTLVLEDQQ